MSDLTFDASAEVMQRELAAIPKFHYGMVAYEREGRLYGLVEIRTSVKEGVGN
jgi:hypothetical protein